MTKPKISKPTSTTPQKPAAKRLTKHEKSLGAELEAHYLEVGITALEDIRHVSLALDGLQGILLRGDEADIAAGNLVRPLAGKLGRAVHEFPDLIKARRKLHDLQVLNSQRKDTPTQGLGLPLQEYRSFLGGGKGGAK